MSSSSSVSAIPFFFLKKQDVKTCLWLSEINSPLTGKYETYQPSLRYKLCVHFLIIISQYFWESIQFLENKFKTLVDLDHCVIYVSYIYFMFRFTVRFIQIIMWTQVEIAG